MGSQEGVAFHTHHTCFVSKSSIYQGNMSRCVWNATTAFASKFMCKRQCELGRLCSQATIQVKAYMRMDWLNELDKRADK
eukprot:12430809-Karenia_brevis.AAC.1